MATPAPITLAAHFADVTDPRIDRTKLHALLDILGIAICAVICGADTWVEIEEYGKAKEAWLKRFLALPNGIPSHDTFARVFARLEPEELQRSFLSWIRAVSQVTQGEVIAIDGKTLRHSYDRGAGKGAIHMVSAWATTNQLVLGQCKVDTKSNEITAKWSYSLRGRSATRFPIFRTPFIRRSMGIMGGLKSDAIGWSRNWTGWQSGQPGRACTVWGWWKRSGVWARKRRSSAAIT